MIEIKNLLDLCAEYERATGKPEKTVSSRVFADSKKLRDLRENGSDMTVGRFNASLQWLSNNWPENAKWPSDITRPEPIFEESA